MLVLQGKQPLELERMFIRPKEPETALEAQRGEVTCTWMARPVMLVLNAVKSTLADIILNQ